MVMGTVFAREVYAAVFAIQEGRLRLAMQPLPLKNPQVVCTSLGAPVAVTGEAKWTYIFSTS